MVRLAIVGCGAVAREYHLPRLIELPHLVEVTALCDRNERSAMLARKQFRLNALTTGDLSMIAGHADAALVAVSPRYHAPVCIELMRSGLDVLCEKPIANTTTEARQMIDVARQHGRLLAIGLTMRFHGNNELLRAVLREGVLGEVREVVAEFGAALDWTMTTDAYYNRQMTAGGVLFDMGVHLVDRVTWLFGALTDISCEDDSYGGVESNSILRGKLNVAGREVPCRMQFSWTHELDNVLRVIGSEATAELPTNHPNVLILKRAGMKFVTTTETENPFRTQLEDFLTAVKTRAQPSVEANSAVESLTLIEKAYAVRTRMAQPWMEA